MASQTLAAASSGAIKSKPCIDFGGRDHGRAHQRHVDHRETHAARRVSAAAHREKASKAALDALYAANRGALVKTPIEEILITRPVPRIEPCAGNKSQGHPYGREIIDAHQSLIIMQSVIGSVDSAPDRAPGIVDQNIHMTMLGQQTVDQAVARFAVARCRSCMW